jgi:beta-phosphoglucomutase-like phosphatase (HAD superfamily)
MRTILFDWDGTIVDSIEALFETTQATCRHLGLPFDREIFRRTFSPNWRLKYRALGITEERAGARGPVRPGARRSWRPR